ncbi:MAG: hypothetical protein J5676_02830 [Bacteroidaceae bacterium]|nr:hypothetical protein [Bacteroidaceae bacterium]
MVGEFNCLDVNYGLILKSDSSFQFVIRGFWYNYTKGHWKMKKDTLTVGNKKHPIDYIELDRKIKTLVDSIDIRTNRFTFKVEVNKNIGSNRIWIENKNEIKILSHISEDGSCWVHTLRRK